MPVRGQGRGGRNSEYLLALALELDGAGTANGESVHVSLRALIDYTNGTGVFSESIEFDFGAAGKVYAFSGSGQTTKTATGVHIAAILRIIGGTGWGEGGYEVALRGANSGTLSFTDPFTDGERQAMKRMMEDIYKQFTTKAAEGALGKVDRDVANADVAVRDAGVRAGPSAGLERALEDAVEHGTGHAERGRDLGEDAGSERAAGQ